MADILVAKRSAIVMFDGRRVTIRAGRTHVRAGHPILDGRQDMFEPIKVEFEVDDEPKAPAKRTRRSKAEGDGES